MKRLLETMRRFIKQRRLKVCVHLECVKMFHFHSKYAKSSFFFFCGVSEHKNLLKIAQLELKKSKRKDYYKVLGVGKNATEDEIKKAYRKRALMHHPGTYFIEIISVFSLYSLYLQIPQKSVL